VTVSCDSVHDWRPDSAVETQNVARPLGYGGVARQPAEHVAKAIAARVRGDRTPMERVPA
jgi:hypothetical protein